jgi:cellulose synthase/poly-beta-1,6-N-acetylglucosamine synthase-like glycosyltransferase
MAFLDADDWWEPDYLARMAELIADYPQAGVYGCNYVYYKPGKTRVALNIPTGYINYPKAYYKGSAMPIWTGATIMPKMVLEEMGGFPLGIKLGEDFLLWAKTALHYKVAFLNEPLAYYNNDVPANMRATRNLHGPEHHMLFRLDLSFGDEKLSEDWQRLLDKLRVNGLLDYWMSEAYHNSAAEELKKVDWSQQPTRVKQQYKTPIWLLKTKRWIMCVGSYWKEKYYQLTK